jgi:hypothetical protein
MRTFAEWAAEQKVRISPSLANALRVRREAKRLRREAKKEKEKQ